MNKQTKRTDNIETGSSSKPGGSTAPLLFAVSPVIRISEEVVACHGPSADTNRSERSSNKVEIPKFSSGGVMNNDPSTTKESKPLHSTSLGGTLFSGVRVVKNDPSVAGAGSLRRTSQITRQRPSKDSYRDRRSALRILKTFGDNPEVVGNPKNSAKIKWAKCILANAQTSGDSTSKRNRSLEESTPVPKRPRVHNPSTPLNSSSRTFSDVLKGKIVVAVIDRSNIDGSISSDQWQVVKLKLSAGFLSVMRDNPGPPPVTSDGGWHQGHVKLIACDDQRSCDLYKLAVSRLGEIWPGARLEVVAREDIPCRPRARTWIPAEPSCMEEILQIIKMSNPSLPTHDWKVAKLEEVRGLYRSAIIVINKDSLAPLAQAKGMMRYGFDLVALKVYKKDEVDADSVPPQLIEAVPAVEEHGTSKNLPSVVDEESMSSLIKAQSSVNVDSLTEMETEDYLNSVLLSEDELSVSGLSSDLEELNKTVVETGLPNCSQNAAVNPD